ncbi:MAG: hypothetical protein L6R39_001893 [Caloplaca ligustica]|nr:MAG: hypothetical protein L6R39_001893 [Caloplaca ligustica]
MQLSTTVLLSSVFSLSLALPSGLSEASSDPDAAPVAIPGRLNVSYTAITYKTLSNLHGPPKASPPFTIKAYNSESPIHLMDINASNDKFFVGNITGSSCPPTIPNCPVGNVTALQVTSTGGAHLYAGVPGGQAIYVGPQGQLRFNNARVPIPSVATKIEFALSPNPIPPPPGISAFVFSGVGKASGYLACPITPQGPWQVFVDLASLQDSWVPGGDISNCTGFDALAADYMNPVPAAYEYVKI